MCTFAVLGMPRNIFWGQHAWQCRSMGPSNHCKSQTGIKPVWTFGWLWELRCVFCLTWLPQQRIEGGTWGDRPSRPLPEACFAPILRCAVCEGLAHARATATNLGKSRRSIYLLTWGYRHEEWASPHVVTLTVICRTETAKWAHGPCSETGPPSDDPTESTLVTSGKRTGPGMSDL